MQPTCMLAPEMSGAEFNNPTTIRSARCNDDVVCSHRNKPYTAVNDPLLLFPFSRRTPATVVQSALGLLAFNWLQMTVWLAFSLAHTAILMAAFRKIDRHQAVFTFPSALVDSDGKKNQNAACRITPRHIRRSRIQVCDKNQSREPRSRKRVKTPRINTVSLIWRDLISCSRVDFEDCSLKQSCEFHPIRFQRMII